MWQNLNNENAKYDNEQLENEILLSWKQVFFLDGPTRCGKTHFLKHLNSENVLITPFCIVIEGMIECFRRMEPYHMDAYQQYCDDMDQRFACRILGFEDVDVSLAGKSATQKEIACILNRLSRNRKIIITGIQIDKRCSSLLRSLGAANYEYFRYVE